MSTPSSGDPASPKAASLPVRKALQVGAFAVPAGALACLVSGVPSWAALLGGLLLALTVGNPHVALTRRAVHLLLSLGVVGLGAGMDLRAVLAAGGQGLVLTAVSITVCLTLGVWGARLLRVSPHAGLLISAGTAICRGSAIAALVPVLRPREHEVSVALGTVFLLNAAALLLFPVLGHAAGLGGPAFGMWCALAIHDTSSVVGAALQYGPEALAVATSVKLARALWIVPVTLLVGAWQRRKGGEVGQGGGRRPWFILGFLLAAALVTFVPSLRPVGASVASAARQVLVLTLFLVGANLSRASLREVGARPLLLGFALWVAMAGGSLLAVQLGLAG